MDDFPIFGAAATITRELKGDSIWVIQDGAAVCLTNDLIERLRNLGGDAR